MFTKETYADYVVLRDSLVSGCDTNLLIAQAVFGFYKRDGRWFADANDGFSCVIELRIPHYSTEIQDAMLIVNHCCAFEIAMLRNGNWFCELKFDKENAKICSANGTLEMAICRAALRASEDEYLKETK
jgi:hypothetical protein